MFLTVRLVDADGDVRVEPFGQCGRLGKDKKVPAMISMDFYKAPLGIQGQGWRGIWWLHGKTGGATQVALHNAVQELDFMQTDPYWSGVAQPAFKIIKTLSEWAEAHPSATWLVS